MWSGSGKKTQSELAGVKRAEFQFLHAKPGCSGFKLKNRHVQAWIALCAQYGWKVY